ncbi:hypothetical protein [Halapricum hydrolyticum]|uniref:Formylmethanofuran dehydrogenase subunit E domain-containing protein n=1 Tax=Halapricum hydrolyticum TaxID=2979991 RepID=A0AAE3I8A6_9EURY|nr:hypothetical protein [Halapricum hydrolyticum]MCU4716944.1 hypothetical protein [Halapricum hydrolyticum]MCU4725451.1 hypothetical protein [Halapricum hydrolyticum]
MTEHTTPTETNSTNWAVEYDAEPIRIRDPAAEALAVLDPGDPFVVTYEDVVKTAGHSCPTASGAYRITQLGLDALYPNSLPVRGEIEVRAGGPSDDATYGVMSRLVSYVTGAAGDDGFGGLGGGHGDRQNLLKYDAFEPVGPDPTFRFQRTDTGDTVEVVYHVRDVPDGGPAIGHLQRILDGTATADDREAFADAWHGRVRAVLADDDLFSVHSLDTGT